MGREWSPGDVAMVKWGGGTEIALRAEQGWSFADMHQWLGDANPHDARPLVVIDAEDREQVERLARASHDAIHKIGDFDSKTDLSRGVLTELMQAALREFADPTPPKPEEPTGLGAVVEDDAGRIYTRYETDAEPQPWWQSAHGPEHDVVRRFSWEDINVVRVLSEGVTP